MSASAPAETPQWRNALDSVARTALDPRQRDRRFRVERDRDDNRWWVFILDGDEVLGGWCPNLSIGRIRVAS